MIEIIKKKKKIKGELFPLSPSASSRWLKCPQSLYEELKEELAGNIKKAGVYADEGTITHKLAELLFQDKDLKIKLGQPVVIKEDNEEREYCVTEEMLIVATDYVAYLNTFKGAEYKKYVECSLQIDNYIKGTADCCIYNASKQEVMIIDLKYGKGVEVKAEKNEQLLLYAWGFIKKLLEESKGSGTKPVIKKISLVIYQPRIKECPDIYSLSFDEFKEFKQIVTTTIDKLIEGSIDFNPSRATCRWCVVREKCEARLAKIGCVISQMQSKQEIKVPEVVRNVRAMVLEQGDDIVKFIHETKKNIKADMQNGIEYPGYKLCLSKSRRKWKDDILEDMAKKYGDVVWEKKLKGITELSRDKIVQEDIDKWTECGTIEKIVKTDEPKANLSEIEDIRNLL